MAEFGTCQECGGQMQPRKTGFTSCVRCGALGIPSTDTRKAIEAEQAEVVEREQEWAASREAADKIDPAAVVARVKAKASEPEPEPNTKPLVPELAELTELRVPDFTEVVLGWRAWRIVRDQDVEVPLLKSAYGVGGFVWMPREPAQALCHRHTDDNGVAHKSEKPAGVPGTNCSCGLYSAKNLEHLKSMGYDGYDHDDVDHMVTVVGEVALWGKVIPGTQGWRSEFGYPKHLYVPAEVWKLAKPLGEAYGVPVTPILREEFMQKYHPAGPGEEE